MTAKPAPNRWPYLEHRTMAEVMEAEQAKRLAAWRERQRLERKSMRGGA